MLKNRCTTAPRQVNHPFIWTIYLNRINYHQMLKEDTAAKLTEKDGTIIHRAIEAAGAITEMIERALLGQSRAVELATCAFLAGGHLLIEDVPGVGKTTLARALARASGGRFSRIQFTSDLLPADITGVSIWDAKNAEFSFKSGPIFGNVVLADEINRSTPKTQSALLEAMGEGRVSIDGTPHPLPRPFMVIATQNEQEHHGTYPLPESQLDRFLIRISMGYPDPEAEKAIISRQTLADPVDSLDAVIRPEFAASIADSVDRVHMDDTVLNYLLAIVTQTRNNHLLALGVGPRAGMALHRATRALALLRGRDYCLVDDVKDLAVPTLAHRVIPTGASWDGSSGRQVAINAISEITATVEIPL
ncbi:MAG: MoxR family ATPase [Myxococcota bacterium]|nr:MoxR family ATPase [Myxococcota bacterium]